MLKSSSGHQVQAQSQLSISDEWVWSPCSSWRRRPSQVCRPLPRNPWALEVGDTWNNEFHTGTTGPFLHTITLAEQAPGNCGYKQIRYPLLPSLAASILALREPIHHLSILWLICVLGAISPRVLDSRIAVKLSPSTGQQRLTIHYAVGWREDSGDSAKASRFPKAGSTWNWQPWANFRTLVIDNTGGGAVAWTLGSDGLGSGRR